MNFGSRLKGFFGNLFRKGSSTAQKLGGAQGIAQKIGMVANIAQKLGGDTTLGKIGGIVSRLPLENIVGTTQKAIETGKEIFQTAQDVRKALNQQPQGASVAPVAVGGKKEHGVLNLEDL